MVAVPMRGTVSYAAAPGIPIHGEEQMVVATRKAEAIASLKKYSGIGRPLVGDCFLDRRTYGRHG